MPGADPASWWALTVLSDDRPLRPEGATVSVSPSRIDGFADCNLRWLLSTCGGEGPSVGAATIGTLVHDIAAELGDVDADTMRAEVEARWGRLGLPAGWVSRRQLVEAQAMVTRLARYFVEAREGGWERVGVELDMQVELGRAVLRGRVDRLERDPDGALRVVDLKTGSSKPAAGDVGRHGQLGAYQVAVEHGAFAEQAPAPPVRPCCRSARRPAPRRPCRCSSRWSATTSRAGPMSWSPTPPRAWPGRGSWPRWVPPASSVPCGPAVPCSPRAG